MIKVFGKCAVRLLWYVMLNCTPPLSRSTSDPRTIGARGAATAEAAKVARAIAVGRSILRVGQSPESAVTEAGNREQQHENEGDWRSEVTGPASRRKTSAIRFQQPRRLLIVGGGIKEAETGHARQLIS